MTKQELIQAVKEIREICEKTDSSSCKDCPFYVRNIKEQFLPGCIFYGDMPELWDIERLERESNENRC